MSDILVYSGVMLPPKRWGTNSGRPSQLLFQKGSKLVIWNQGLRGSSGYFELATVNDFNFVKGKLGIVEKMEWITPRSGRLNAGLLKSTTNKIVTFLGIPESDYKNIVEKWQSNKTYYFG